MNALQGSGAWFEDVRVGDRFDSAVTVTETHIVMGAGLIGDFNPHHMRGSQENSRSRGSCTAC